MEPFFRRSRGGRGSGILVRDSGIRLRGAAGKPHARAE